MGLLIFLINTDIFDSYKKLFLLSKISKHKAQVPRGHSKELNSLFLIKRHYLTFWYIRFFFFIFLWINTFQQKQLTEMFVLSKISKHKAKVSGVILKNWIHYFWSKDSVSLSYRYDFSFSFFLLINTFQQKQLTEMF